MLSFCLFCVVLLPVSCCLFCVVLLSVSCCPVVCFCCPIVCFALSCFVLSHCVLCCPVNIRVLWAFASLINLVCIPTDRGLAKRLVFWPQVVNWAAELQRLGMGGEHLSAMHVIFHRCAAVHGSAGHWICLLAARPGLSSHALDVCMPMTLGAFLWICQASAY